MELRLKSKLKSIKYPPPELSMSTVKRFIEEITKVAHLQIVAYMALFNEHEEEFLTDSQVKETLTFLKAKWFDFYDCREYTAEKSWAVKVHKLLNFESDKTTHTLTNHKYKMYSVCWNLVSRFWIEDTGRSLIFPDGGQGKKFDSAQVINMIIFYLNYGKISSTVARNKQMKIRKKFVN
jgi:hypothetical protein